MCIRDRQQVVHEVAGGELRQGHVEMEHGHHVHTRALQEIEFLLQRGEQADVYKRQREALTKWWFVRDFERHTKWCKHQLAMSRT